jgi:sucrose phosphorylase
MRPTEGILSEPQRKALVDRACAHQGAMTGKRNSDGSVSPYELNLNYFDAINNPLGNEPLATQIDRFMLSQSIPLSFIGIPGIYIHSLIGSRNDLAGVQRTGRARSINRQQLAVPELRAALADPTSLRHQVFNRYRHLLEIRGGQPAFHPNSPQSILDLGPGIFALQRHDPTTGQTILALHNVTSQPLTTPVRITGRDLLNAEPINSNPILNPYQVRWIELGD